MAILTDGQEWNCFPPSGQIQNSGAPLGFVEPGAFLRRTDVAPYQTRQRAGVTRSATE